MSAVAPLMQEGKHSLFTFRLFHGITAFAWARLLAQHRFAISPSRLPLVLQISAMSVVNSTLGSIQNLVFSDRIAASTIDAPPIFILGHWRTGTTYLHELIALDDAFTAPTSLDAWRRANSWSQGGWRAFFPSCFLKSGRWTICWSAWIVRRRTKPH